MPDRSRKLPRDPNQLAKRIVDLVTEGEADEPRSVETKDPAAVSLGRRGGLKGGRARADSLTPEQRSKIARLAAKARYSKKK